MVRKGDRVRVTEEHNSAWMGEALVAEPESSFGYVELLMTTGSFAGCRGSFQASRLEMVEPAIEATVDTLRAVVEGLREQGYGIKVTVTEPPAPPAVYAL